MQVVAYFGYKPKGQKVLEVDARKAVVVRRLFELRQIFKHWSLNQLAEQLNVEGYCTAKGKQFTKVQVKRMLDRENFIVACINTENTNKRTTCSNYFINSLKISSFYYIYY